MRALRGFCALAFVLQLLLAGGAFAEPISGSGLQPVKNLADVRSASAARTNLGLGASATRNTTGSGLVVTITGGAPIVGHVATFADTAGTVQDGGLLAFSNLSGTLACAQLAALTGDVIGSVGSCSVAMAAAIAGNKTFSGGIAVGSPTGGTPAAGSLNAQGLYVNNAAVLTSQEWTAGNVSAIGGLLSLTGGTLSVTAVTGVTAGAGLTTTLGATGGTISSSGTLSTNVPIQIKSGSGAYAFLDTDRASLIEITWNANTAPTIPQAGTGSAFLNGWYGYVDATAHSQVLTPATSTINGNTALGLAKNQPAEVISDGTNYQAVVSSAIVWDTANGGAYLLPYSNLSSPAGNLGANGVDVQLYRSGATQTAQGPQSFVAGENNRVGSTSEAGIALGRNNFAGGNFSAVVGNNGTDRSNIGAFIFSGAEGAQAGTSQTEVYIVEAFTSGASAVRLTTDQNSAGSGNVAALANKSSHAFKIYLVARDDTANSGAGATWTYTARHSDGLNGCLMTRGANAASTALASGCTWTAGPTAGSPGSISTPPTVTADTTNGGYNISFTPPSGNTDSIQIVAKLSVEVEAQ